MVEVFDFQKNFATGKEIRKSKFKDNSMTKGVATIEVLLSLAIFICSSLIP